MTPRIIITKSVCAPNQAGSRPGASARSRRSSSKVVGRSVDLLTLEPRGLLSFDPVTSLFADWSRITTIRPAPQVGPIAPDPTGTAMDADPSPREVLPITLLFQLGPRLGPGPEIDPPIAAFSPPGPPASITAAQAKTMAASGPPPLVVQPDFLQVSMAQAITLRDGLVDREFAFADQVRSEISVRDGSAADAKVVGGPGDGVRHPEAIALADLDGDQVADMIVANSGANNILIYRGLLAGGFASEMNAGKGIVVGSGPGGITVGDIDGDGFADVIIANRNSNSVTILRGQGTGVDWSLKESGQIEVGSAPVFTSLDDVDNDGVLDLIVCNSGSDSVMVFHGYGDGRFDDLHPRVLPVGQEPVKVFVGRFDHREDLEMLTVNAKSNDLTMITDFMGAVPTYRTIASGGINPSAAVAADLNLDGYTDLVVANTGSGNLAYFQGGSSGLNLTWIATSAEIPIPTAIVLGNQDAGGFEIYAVSSGQNAATTFRFDINQFGEYEGVAPVPPTLTQGSKDSENQASAELFTRSSSGFHLVGVLGLSSRSQDQNEEESRPEHETRPGRGVYARSGVQSLDDDEEDLDFRSEDDDGLAPAPKQEESNQDSAWMRFVLGYQSDLDQARSVASHAIASPEDFEDSPWSGPEIAQRNQPGTVTPSDPSAIIDEALAGLVDDADVAAWVGPPLVEPGDSSRERKTGVARTIPVLSLGLIFTHQLLVRILPSRRFPMVRPSRKSFLLASRRGSPVV